MQEKIIILDFGSQTTQLIGRRVRELSMYCEIVPYNKFPADDPSVIGVILSGSPFSVYDEKAFRINVDEIAERYPDMVKKIDALGHEVGFHGYDHEAGMYTDRTTEEWIRVVERSQEVFQRLIGKPAVGYVATSCDFQADAPRIWHQQLGFQYSSSMRGDDRPYRWDFGQGATDFIEIPARWELDDYPAFVYSYDPPQPRGQDRVSSYRGVLSNWKHEFDGYYALGGCMCWMLHPQIIGIPGRAQLLEEIIDYMRERPDVWIATGREIADWWREHDGKEVAGQ